MRKSFEVDAREKAEVGNECGDQASSVCAATEAEDVDFVPLLPIGGDEEVGLDDFVSQTDPKGTLNLRSDSFSSQILDMGRLAHCILYVGVDLRVYSWCFAPNS